MARPEKRTKGVSGRTHEKLFLPFVNLVLSPFLGAFSGFLELRYEILLPFWGGFIQATLHLMHLSQTPPSLIIYKSSLKCMEGSKIPVGGFDIRPCYFSSS